LKQPLDKSKVQMAQLFVDDLHPLQSTKIYDAFSLFLCWYKPIAKCFEKK